VETTPASLLLRVRNLADQESWEAFVELYGPIILRYVRQKGVRQDDALDLVQDVLQIVMCRIGTFQYDPNKSFRAWLRTVASNRAKRHFLQHSRKPQSPGGSDHQQIVGQVPDLDNDQDDLIEQEWRKRRFEIATKRVRDNVTAQSWKVFELRYHEGLPSAQVAERLDMNIGAVYTSMSRVLVRLKKAMEEIDE